MGFSRIEREFRLLADWQIGGEAIGAGGHDEVVPVQAANLMRPPGNGDAGPLCENSRMMSFGFGERADFVREFERFDKVLEAKCPLQSGNSVALDDLPVGDLWLELSDLLVGYSRGIGATGGTFGFL
jgi:hypothetical protein